MQKSTLSLKYDYDLGQNLLLRKIQSAAINRQIKKRIGLTLWRILFKDCRHDVDSDQIIVIAPNERMPALLLKDIGCHWKSSLTYP